MCASKPSNAPGSKRCNTNLADNKARVIVNKSDDLFTITRALLKRMKDEEGKV